MKCPKCGCERFKVWVEERILYYWTEKDDLGDSIEIDHSSIDSPYFCTNCDHVITEDEAIELMEKIRKNLEPRDELIKKYGDKYPVFLIDLVSKNLFSYSNFKEKIDVIGELEKLRILDKEYKYVGVDKLEKATEILAKGYASKANKEKKRGIFGV